jgi:hypothetical protein
MELQELLTLVVVVVEVVVKVIIQVLSGGSGIVIIRYKFQ